MKAAATIALIEGKKMTANAQTADASEEEVRGETRRIKISKE